MDTIKPVSYKQIATTTALVLATLALAYVTYLLGQVVLLFVLSILVAAGLRAPMLRLQQRGMSRGLAILLLYILVVAILAGGGFLFSYPLSVGIERASERFPRLYDTIARSWQNSPSRWQQFVAGVLPDTNELISNVGQHSNEAVVQLGGLTYNVANLIISLVAVLTLTFYWLVDEDRFVRLWLSLLPVQQRTVARHTWYDIDRRVGLFVRSEFMQFILTIVLLYAGLRALGVTYPALWALYGSLAQLIPWVGIPLTLLPAIPMFWYDSLPVTIGAIVLIIAVGTFMDRAVEPWFGVQRIVHPIVSVLALMIMGEAAGLIGMLTALPLAAAVQSILSQLLQVSTGPRAVSQSAYASQLQTLRERLAQLHTAPARDQNHQRELDALYQRISGLLDKTEHVVEERARAPQRRRMPSRDDLRSRAPAFLGRNRTR